MRPWPITFVPIVILAVVGIVCGLAATCEPFKPTEENAGQDVSNMRFVRHANGLCFGVVRFATYGGDTGVSVTMVPSEACAPR